MDVSTCFGGRPHCNNHNNYDQSNDRIGKDSRKRKAYRHYISWLFNDPLQFGKCIIYEKIQTIIKYIIRT